MVNLLTVCLPRPNASYIHRYSTDIGIIKLLCITAFNTIMCMGKFWRCKILEIFLDYKYSETTEDLSSNPPKLSLLFASLVVNNSPKF